MPKVDVQNMRAALFVEVEGDTFLVALPYERMKLLLPLAASLFDGGKLDLSPTTLFNFNAALESVVVPHAVKDDAMRAEFEAWVQDQGCDTDGAWSAWQGAWNRRAATPSAPSSSQQGEADAKAVARAIAVFEEALPYIGSPSWSPSMLSEAEQALAGLRASLESAKSGEVGNG